MPSVAVPTTAKGMSFEPDLLAGDLDAYLPGFSEGRQLLWGLALGAVENAWTVEEPIQGIDWDVRFYPERALKIPRLVRRTTRRTYWQTIPTSCALFRVQTGESDLDKARDVGRSRVRELVAIVRREVPILLPREIQWEGAIVRTLRGTVKMMRAERSMASSQAIESARLQKVGLHLLHLDISELPPHLGQALEWLTLARSARVRSEQFTHLWLAMIAIIDHGDRVGVMKSRIERYAAGMTSLAPSQKRDIAQRLKDAYDLRNDLWHDGLQDGITPTLLQSLEDDAFKLVDFELVKIGKAITWS